MATADDGQRDNQDADDRSLSPPPSNVEQSDRIKGRCDVCDKKDLFQDFMLRKCKTCGVCVHETCYGLVQTAHGRPDPDWRCHACKATGEEIIVSKPGQEKKTVVQEERPVDCALCPIVGGVHAMHPLYDTHGKLGRQVVLRADRARDLPKRLAWVHTLCALGIAKSRLAGGCVFGCLADGSFQGDEDDETRDTDDDDEDYGAEEPRRKKSRQEDNDNNDGQESGEADLDSSESEEGSDSGVAAVHHFVIAGKENGEETEWTKIIAECRASLKCYLCGNRGCSPLHIPLQCTANDDNEFEDYKKRHEDSEPCLAGLHVGCARWDPSGQHRRVFFWPGYETGVSGQFSDPVDEIYCDMHAKEIWKNNPKREKEFAPRHQISRHTRAANTAHRYIPPPEDIVKKHDPSRLAATSSRTMAKSQSTRMKPTQQKPNGSNRQGRAMAMSSVPSEASKFSRPSFEDIRDDVVKVIRSAQDRGADVKEATTRCRKHWKRQAGSSEAEKDDFKKVWLRVQVAINEMPEFREGSANDAVENGGAKADEAKRNHVPGTSNPWSSLWVPSYNGGPFDFGSWDAYNEYDI